MEQQFQSIQSLLSLDQCIFSMQSMDYPSLWQQQFLQSYLSIHKIIRKDHTQIIRQLHSATEKSLQSIAQGFIYFTLLSTQHFEQLLKYMRVLKVEVWNMIDKSLQTLLKEHANQIKSVYYSNIDLLYAQLIIYDACSISLLCEIIKFIDPYDDRRYQSSLKIIQRFLGTLQKQENTLSQHILEVYFEELFMKAVTLLKFVQFRRPCLFGLIENIWRLDHRKCSTLAYDIFEQLQMVQKRDRSAIQQEMHRHVKEAMQTYVEPYQIRIRVLSIRLPRRQQSLLYYLLESDNLVNMGYQLKWLVNQWQSRRISYELILIDMAAWIPLSVDQINQRIYLLDWICKAAESVNSTVYEKVKKNIMERWFRQMGEFEPFLTSVYLLKHFLYKNARTADDFLTYVLRNQQFGEVVRKVFITAHENGHLRLQEIKRHDLITSAVKEEYQKMLAGQQPQQTSNFVYDPQKSPSVSQKKVFINDISYDHPQLFVPSRNLHNPFTLKLDEQFVISMGAGLTDLLNDPTIANFHCFIDKVYEIGTNIAKDDRKEDMSLLYKEIARVLYVMYNNQFQQFNITLQKHQSVLYQLLQTIAAEWYRTTKKLVILKNIIRNLCQCFPTAQIAIWKCFLTYFETSGASSRKMKEWLVPSNKASYVIPSIQCLSGVTQSTLRKKAAKYGIK